MGAADVVQADGNVALGRLTLIRGKDPQDGLSEQFVDGVAELRSASVARSSASLRPCSTASIWLWVVPTRRIMINDATIEATSSANATKKAGAVGTGVSRSQMHAAAANARAMPPSSHCSAERDKLMVG